jgi:hypothetical protein
MRRSTSFFAEPKRRNVIRMAGLYLVGAWLLTQVASTVLPMFDLRYDSLWDPLRKDPRFEALLQSSVASEKQTAP